MNIALVGYGKMGHIIANCAKEAGHEIAATIDIAAKDATNIIEAGDYEMVARVVKSVRPNGIIEFSHPSAVMGNINALLPLGIPMVVGTTGWHHKEGEVASLCARCGSTLMTSNNFSIGVNMFYKIVKEAVKALEEFSEYDIAVHEMHHNQKADSPSGTAMEIANIILDNTKKKSEIVSDEFHTKPAANQLHVSSTRCGSVPGTHSVFFDSPADTITLTHTARSREGFAWGAVHSLEKLVAMLNNGELTKGKLYHMEDLF